MAPAAAVLYIVVDTNVLLTHFDCTEFIRTHTTIPGSSPPRTFATIVVPWIVLCELDGLKQGKKGEMRRRAEDSTCKYAIYPPSMFFPRLAQGPHGLCVVFLVISLAKPTQPETPQEPKNSFPLKMQRFIVLPPHIDCSSTTTVLLNYR